MGAEQIQGTLPEISSLISGCCMSTHYACPWKEAQDEASGGHWEVHSGPWNQQLNPAVKATNRGDGKERQNCPSRPSSKVWICRSLGMCVVFSLDHSIGRAFQARLTLAQCA